MTINIDLSDFGDEPQFRLEDCSAKVLDKARGMLDRVQPEASAVDGQFVFTVKDTYRVIIQTENGLPVWASCTCPHGMHSMRYDRIGCSHVAAAFMTRE